MFDKFVGIVSGPVEESLSIGIIDISKKTIIAETFKMNPAKFNDYFIISENNSPSLDTTTDLSDLYKVSDFIFENIQDTRSARFLIEAPKIFPYPLDNYNSAPCPLFNADSISLRVIALLSYEGYIAWQFFTTNQNSILIERLPNLPEYINMRRRQVRFVTSNISNAYADFLLGNSPSSEQAAVVAALLAKNGGAYYFWSSFGVVQSVQDLITDLSFGQHTGRVIAHSGEIFTINYPTPLSSVDTTKLRLHYESGSEKFKHLGVKDSLKAGLMNACKKFDIQIRCRSSREDASKEDSHPYIVYPVAPEDLWIIENLHKKG